MTAAPKILPTDWPVRRFRAALFDMDGTIVNSIAAAERVWGAWAQAHGLDVAAFLPTIHGKRSQDTIAALNLPGLDPEAEARRINRIEIDTVDGVAAIAGADAFLRGLPADRWAVVTSAPRALALARIAAAGLPLPRVLIASEDVRKGKPDPEPFLRGAAALGVAPEDCLVFEDAPAGVAAGLSAGAQVIAITETHPTPFTGAVPACRDYRRLRVTRDGDALRLNLY